MRIRQLFVVTSAVLRRPRLWGTAVRTVPSLARRRWWTRFPFLPLPDPAYLRWRVATAYGDAEAPLSSHDIVAYLEWRKRQH